MGWKQQTVAINKNTRLYYTISKVFDIGKLLPNGGPQVGRHLFKQIQQVGATPHPSTDSPRPGLGRGPSEVATLD